MTERRTAAARSGVAAQKETAIYDSSLLSYPAYTSLVGLSAEAAL